MKSLHIISVLGLALIGTIYFNYIASAANAKTYYLSPLGSDTNTGTSQNNPLKSLAKANAVLAPGDTHAATVCRQHRHAGQ